MPLRKVESNGIVLFVPAAAGGIAFTSRIGGRSSGPYSSLNLSEAGGDSFDSVAENRRTISRALEIGDDWLTVRQVHGTSVVHAPPVASTSNWSRPEADAIIGSHHSPPMAVLTADCLPIAITGPSTRAVVHAGWRGLCSGIIDRVLSAAPDPPDKLQAWIGPSIGPCHFAVGPEVSKAFTLGYPGAPEFATTRRTKGYFDLWAAARWILTSRGVLVEAEDPPCTSCEPLFFSHRRDGLTGRQALLVWGSPA